MIAIAFSGIAIKLILKKNGEFSGTCASQSPFLNNSDEPCGICGKIPTNSECANDTQ
ncbi:membrane or secreted protein [Flavobacteriaceae bacterium]|nr:membrane or secreted protein [Flavobacteriaceae bacterium]MDG2475395.1 membrane or secreted protein [Flavobacteriaceae bacterium]